MYQYMFDQQVLINDNIYALYLLLFSIVLCKKRLKKKTQFIYLSQKSYQSFKENQLPSFGQHTHNIPLRSHCECNSRCKYELSENLL